MIKKGSSKDKAWAICTWMHKQGKLTEGGEMPFPFFKLKEYINSDQSIVTKVCDSDTGECKLVEFKIDPNAKTRNRGDVVFPANSSLVSDKQDHFPINSLAQARNALARAGQYSTSPPWFKGSLSKLISMVKAAVKRKYPAINVGGEKKAEDTCANCYEDSFRTIYEVPINEMKFEDADITLADGTKEKGKIASVEMIRSGTFNHPWYGMMKFDNEVLDSFIKNFENNVVGRDLSFDYNHNNQTIAAGWLRDIQKTKRKIREKDKKTSDVLVGIVEVTNRAKEYLDAGELKYFSIEFLMDYADNETGKHYGPTLLGGGFTNRPFIKFLAPAKMELSEDTMNYVAYEELDEEKYEELVNEEDNLNNGGDQVKFEEILRQLKEAQDAIKVLHTQLSATASDKVTLQANIDGLNKIVDGLQKKLEEAKKVEDAAAAATVEADKVAADKAAAEKLAQETAAEKKKREDAEAAVKAKKASEDNKEFSELKETVKKLEESNKTLADEKIKSQIITFEAKAKSEGIPPSILDPIVKKLNDNKISLADAQDIINGIPANAKVDLSETTSSKQQDNKSDKFKSVADVIKYADEKKISFGDAAIDLATQGFELEN